MNETICSIYEKRPDICRNFPTSESEIRHFDKCGYYFKDGKRYGECNGCGQCCVYMHFPDELTVLSCDSLEKAPVEYVWKEDGTIKSDVICRFLIGN